MTMAKTMPRQPGKRRQGRVGKGDVQFGQTKRKGALICFIFGRYNANLQDPQRCRTTPPLVLLNWSVGKKTNFQNHGTGLAYHHNYEPVRAKSLMPDNAGRFGSCA